MKKTFAAIIVIAIFAIEGCTPAEKAEAGQVENIVLTDIKAGKTQEQIEADVAKLVIGDAGIAIVDNLIIDAIQVLVDLNVIPATDLPATNALASKLQGMPGAHRHQQ